MNFSKFLKYIWRNRLCFFTEDSKIDSGSKASEAIWKKPGQRSDAQLKEMLSTLVHEANFLVEDNLNLLVDDIPEDERKLFKLDSILTAIGLTGELEVMEILRKHDEANISRRESDQSMEALRDSIMKVIRTHIEQNRMPGEGAGLTTDRSSRLSRKKTLASAGPSASRSLIIVPGLTDTQRDLLIDDEDEDDESSSEWSTLKERISVFSSGYRLHLLEALKKYHQTLVERSELLSKNQTLRKHNDELAMLLRRSTA